MNIAYIAIGTELTDGRVQEKNSLFLAKTLRSFGLGLEQIRIIKDSKEKLHQCFTELANSDSDVLIFSGGLGPTQDDLSLAEFSKFIDHPLIFKAEIQEHIEKLFKSKKKDYKSANEKQCYIPETSSYFLNKAGTAPIVYGQFLNKHWVFLPGVPFEFEQNLHKVLKSIDLQNEIPKEYCDLLIPFGSESEIQSIIDGIVKLPPDKISFLASEEGLRLRWEKSIAELENLGKNLFQMGILSIPTSLPLAELLTKLLDKKKQTISLAESCTGGRIAALLTAVPGSSAVFPGSVVSYSNEQKTALLAVAPELLIKDGAVSEACVEAMSQGLEKQFNTSFCLSVSGIAGPGGGSKEKPVGTVYFCLKGPKGSKTLIKHFSGSRNHIQHLAACYGLKILLKDLLS